MTNEIKAALDKAMEESEYVYIIECEEVNVVSLGVVNCNFDIKPFVVEKYVIGYDEANNTVTLADRWNSIKGDTYSLDEVYMSEEEANAEI